MNIFYRGHVIHEEIRSICCTVFGRRPVRRELASCDSTMAAMQWVDRQVAAGEAAVTEPSKQVAVR
ncbi:MAG: hypothetical protein J4N84_13720 [Chloroflexi bacterium]|nr:hypothetical protein [Chloroflexota bacterium]